ncbi:MAG: hypothetical protein EP330_12675 [Deltaproteobacteria bacterium]|nr:MAG: hypothetical protein EP330_12675 [Deltaproteobacteria bacterium]
MRALLLVLALAGCKNDCGTYSYKGVQGTEWCGDVYGTEGEVYEDEAAPSNSWVHLWFRHDVPPNEFSFDHGGSVHLWLLWDDLESGEELGAEAIYGECNWIDYGVPLDDTDDVERLEAPTEVSLESHGARFNLDVGTSYVRKLEWHVLCGEGEFRLDAKDIVELERLGPSNGPPNNVGG